MKSALSPRIITNFSLLGSLLVFLSVINFGSLLFRFIAVGEVPGTTYIVPADGMYVLLTIIALLSMLLLAIDLQKSFARISRKSTPARQSRRRHAKA